MSNDMRAALPPHQPGPSEYTHILCYAWGESDFPVAALVQTRADVRRFLAEQWFGSDDDPGLDEAMRRFDGERDDGESWDGTDSIVWEFEIGGVRLTKVYEAMAAQDAPQPAAEPPEWWHLKAYGYAPGGYMSKCHRCGQTPINMDKRAVTCRPCAEAMHTAAQAAAGSAEPVVRINFAESLKRYAVFDEEGLLEPAEPFTWETLARVAIDLANAATAAPQPPAAPTQAQVAPVAKRLTVDGVAQCLEHILRTQYSSTTAHELAIARAIETAFCRLNGLEVAP